MIILLLINEGVNIINKNTATQNNTSLSVDMLSSILANGNRRGMVGTGIVVENFSDYDNVIIRNGHEAPNLKAVIQGKVSK